MRSKCPNEYLQAKILSVIGLQQITLPVSLFWLKGVLGKQGSILIASKSKKKKDLKFIPISPKNYWTYHSSLKSGIYV